MVQGKARKWCESTFVILVQHHGHIHWEHFCQAFIDHHVSPVLHRAKELELLTIKQGDSIIDDYQKHFSDFLTYSPHVTGDPVAKYFAFSQWFEPRNFYHVFVCDDSTSYEGLLNRCRQADL